MQLAIDERIEETERGCEGTIDSDLYVRLTNRCFFLELQEPTTEGA